MSSPNRWRRAWWIWFALLFALSSVPGNRLGPRPFDWFDKLEHAGFFFLGGLILGGWLAATGRWPARWWLLPVVAAAVGAFDEAHQSFTPGRSGLDAGDWAADIFGGSLAALAVPLMLRWQARRAERQETAPPC
jgi:VanZ family protein